MTEPMIDHYGHHKALLVGALACFGIWMALVGPLGIETPITPVGPIGILWALAGRKASLGGQSAVQGVGSHFFGTTLALDRMNPHQRARHASVTGWLMILTGVAAACGEALLLLARHGVIATPWLTS